MDSIAFCFKDMLDEAVPHQAAHTTAYCKPMAVQAISSKTDPQLYTSAQALPPEGPTFASHGGGLDSRDLYAPSDDGSPRGAPQRPLADTLKSNSGYPLFSGLFAADCENSC